MDTTGTGHHEQPLPEQVLPIPDYEVGNRHEQIFSADNDSLAFFEDCANGNLENVMLFVETYQPCHGDRQRGLELATFEGRIPVIRYLLEQGTKIHSRMFERRDPTDTFSAPHQTYADHDWTDGFLSDAGDDKKASLVLQILQLFHEFGWHPNQPWTRPGMARDQCYVLLYPAVLKNRPLLEWLLSIGADPNLKTPQHSFWGTRGSHIIDTAARMHRLDVLDLLFIHGLRTDLGKPLHMLPQILSGKLWPDRDISSRFTTAQWFLDHGFDINSVRDMHDHSMIPGAHNGTPLAVACAKRDWDMAEWLLDRGADPEVEGRCAYNWESYMFGPTGWEDQNPNRLAELVERRNQRLRDEEKEAEEKKKTDASVEEAKQGQEASTSDVG